MARARASTTVTRELLEPKRKKGKKNAGKRRPAPAPKDETLARVLERVSADPPQAALPQRSARQAVAVSSMRTARVGTVAGRAAEIVYRGERLPTVAVVGEDVETAVVEQAARDHSMVLVEVVAGLPPAIVGVLQTRMPRSIVLKGTTVEIEAEREILLRTGRGALRIREDGDIELIGSRISAVSRGLFRIVGKMLRLN